MKTRKYKQRGGSIDPYTADEINQLQGVGFTDDQIRYLNDIKINYGLESLNAVGIIYIIGENNDGMTPTAYTASYEDDYPFFGDTDNEEETDDEGEGGNQLGGNKKTRRKRRSRYSIKRETRRRRRSIKRKQAVRKKTRKSRRRRR